MHDHAAQSQTETTESVATRAACGVIGAFGLAAAIGLSSGGHDILGASLGLAAGVTVIWIDHVAARRRMRARHAALVASLDVTPLSDRSDDLSIPPFASLPHDADTRGPAPSGPPQAGSRNPLLPADLKAQVMDFPPLVQAALLVLGEADRSPADQETVRIDVAAVTRLRRAVSAEIETRVRAAAAYPKAAALKAVR